MYTKGEWRIQDMPLPARGFVRIEGNGVEVARIHKLEGQAKYYGIKQLPEETQANAHLIAAAPDMYEALKEAIKELIIHTTKHDLGMIALVEKAQEALSKAEGK